MARLRKVLGDEARQPIFVETVQRKGYRWLKDAKPVVNIPTYKKHPIIIFATVILLSTAIGVYQYQPKEEFLFPELSIKKLPDGGYEIEAAIEGKLTEEKKAAMLQEIKRITGEENSDMEFTFDTLTPTCFNKENQKVSCKSKEQN